MKNTTVYSKLSKKRMHNLVDSWLLPYQLQRNIRKDTWRYTHGTGSQYIFICTDIMAFFLFKDVTQKGYNMNTITAQNAVKWTRHNLHFALFNDYDDMPHEK